MGDLIPSFRDSVLAPLSEPASDFLEIGIDALLENEALKTIPFVNTVVGLCKVGVNLHERNLLRQTASFIAEVNDGTIDPEKLEQHRSELKQDPEKAERELGRVLIILGNQVDVFQSRVLGSFYKAFLQGSINWEKFCELSEANSRMFSADYAVLLRVNEPTGFLFPAKDAYQIDRLVSLGLLKSMSISRSEIDNLISSRNETMQITTPKFPGVQLTSFGKTFLQHMINENQYRKAYRTYLSAKGFLSAADILRQVGRKDGLKLFAYYAYPLSVNAAFSCELFIKSLLALEETEYNRGHYLYDLYSLLSHNAKTRIKNRFSESGSTEDVEELVKAYNRAFVEWRYPFDPENDEKTLTIVWSDFLILCMALQIENKRKLKEYPYFDKFNVEGDNNAD